MTLIFIWNPLKLWNWWYWLLQNTKIRRASLPRSVRLKLSTTLLNSAAVEFWPIGTNVVAFVLNVISPARDPPSLTPNNSTSFFTIYCSFFKFVEVIRFDKSITNPTSAMHNLSSDAVSQEINLMLLLFQWLDKKKRNYLCNSERFLGSRMSYRIITVSSIHVKHVELHWWYAKRYMQV